MTLVERVKEQRAQLQQMQELQATTEATVRELLRQIDHADNCLPVPLEKRPILTVAQAAKLFDVTEAFLNGAFRQGKLPAIDQPGLTRRFRRESLDRFFEGLERTNR